MHDHHLDSDEPVLNWSCNELNLHWIEPVLHWKTERKIQINSKKTNAFAVNYRKVSEQRVHLIALLQLLFYVSPERDMNEILTRLWYILTSYNSLTLVSVINLSNTLYNMCSEIRQHPIRINTSCTTKYVALPRCLSQNLGDDRVNKCGQTSEWPLT